MRKLNSKELKLMSKLLAKAELEADLETLEVSELKDGGMGSLGIGSEYHSRTFGKEVSTYEFTDSDGIEVSATLNLDTEGNLYELDVFKADFSPTESL